MGTNYYFDDQPCKECGRSDGRRHIGKSSYGWCFALHVYPEDNLNTLEDWMTLLRATVGKGTGKLVDEYERPVTIAELYAEITERSHPNAAPDTATFHQENFSEPGPRNLLRHQIVPDHCIGHGPGTWDLLVGDFS